MSSKYLFSFIFLLLITSFISAQEIDLIENPVLISQDVFYPPEEELLKQGMTLESYIDSLKKLPPKNRDSLSSVDNIWGTSPLSGTIHIPVLLVNFTDRPSTDNLSQINNYFNSSDYNSNFVSVSKYYNKQSYGQLNIIYDVYNWQTMPHTFTYYSSTVTNEFKLVIDAVNTFNPSVNFAQYDNDNDGRLDGIVIVFSGNSTSIEPAIWPQTRILRMYNSYPVDGKYLGNAALIPEKGVRNSNNFEIAVTVHEFAHILGLPDLYNTTDLSNTGPLYQMTMMHFSEPLACLSKPINLDAWSRYFLGWINPEILTTESPKEISLRSVNDYPDAVILKNNNFGPREFFIIENRYKQKDTDPTNLDNCLFSGGFPFYSSGFAIYHVEENKIEASYPNNQINSDPDGSYYTDTTWPGITYEENYVASTDGSISATSGDLYYFNPFYPGVWDNFDENVHLYQEYATFDMTTKTYTGISNPLIRFTALSPTNQYTMTAKMLVGEETKTPTATLESGTYPQGTQVTLNTITPQATIYYTTDGTDPTTSSTIYTTPITLPSGDITLKAIAKKNNYYVSDILEKTYTIENQTVAAPTASHLGGEILYRTPVTLSTTTSQATIRYTLDGTEPIETSPIYTYPIYIVQPTTLKVKAFKDGQQPSETVTYNYQVKLLTPRINIESGIYPFATKIKLISDVPGAQIYYTTDGTEPNDGQLYTTYFRLLYDMHLKAIVKKSGYIDSEIITKNYNVSNQVQEVPKLLIDPKTPRSYEDFGLIYITEKQWGDDVIFKLPKVKGCKFNLKQMTTYNKGHYKYYVFENNQCTRRQQTRLTLLVFDQNNQEAVDTELIISDQIQQDIIIEHE